MTKHQLENILAGEEIVGVRCTVCCLEWHSAPWWECPGVPVYSWEAAPEHLRTKTQLRKMRLALKADAQPSGCLGSKRHGWIWLYDPEQTTEPMAPLTEKQVQAFANASERARQRRTCTRCGTEQASRRYLVDGLCENCLHLDMLAEARSDAVKWAHKMMTTTDSWVVLDTETTGLGNDAEIVQVAVLNPHTGESYQSLIRPQQPIPADATAIHGITDEMVLVAPEFPVVYQHLVELLFGKRAVIYNADFDLTMLWLACRRYNLPTIKPEAVCVMKRYAGYVGEWLEYYQDFRWQPLPGGDHTALGDCQATLALIKQMAELPAGGGS